MLFHNIRPNMKSRVLKNWIIEKNKSILGRIIVLTGARQTGKTTLVKHCFPEYTYLSIEDPVLRLEYKKLTANQWRDIYPKALLDEIQKEPQLIESIKSVYDQYDEPRYILLGSSHLLLLKKVKESLAGRCIIQEVFPLTIPELLTKGWNDKLKLSFLQEYLKNGKLDGIMPNFKLCNEHGNRIKVFKYYLQFGGYPALTNIDFSDSDRFEWLNGYIKTYLERDIRDLADFKSLDPFVKIQKTTSILTGQLINYTYLGNETGVSSKTAKRFLEYLDISYQTIALQPWHRNELKRLVKTPKLHYLDPGVQRAILKKRGELSGNEFESAIIAEIYKQLKLINFSGSFYHLRTVDGKEIDLLLELEHGFIAIEVKMSSNIKKSDARHLFNLDTILDKPVIQSFILSNDERIKQFGRNIMALPAAMFLS